MTHKAGGNDAIFMNSNLLDSIIQSSDDAIVSKDLDGIVTSWNPAAEMMFGYSAEEIIGKPMRLIFPEERLNEEDSILEKIARGEPVRHFRTQRKHKSGRLLDVSVTISPVINGAGEIIGASKIARDITQEALRDLENNHFRAIVESSDDAIISKDLNGIVQSWNAGAEKVFGFTAQEMVGEPMIKVFPQDRLHEEPDILSRLARGEKVDHFRTIRKRKDGSLIHVSATISPIYNHLGEVIGASKIAKDITAQVEVERLTREFQSIIETSNDAIISQSLKGEILSWNPAAEQLLGFAASEMIGQSIYSIIPDEAHQAHDRLLRSLHSGAKVTDHRAIYMTKHGEKVRVSQNLSPVFNADSSEVIGASQIARDTTEADRERAEIWKKANFDNLTGLANRAYFINRTKQLIKSNAVSGAKSRFYVAFIDVDSFKAFNDNFGHKVGDGVLTAISRVLTENCRSTDVAGRFAGDEFVLLIKDDFQHFNVNKFFNHLIEKVNEPVIIEGREFRISISVGVASFPEHGVSVEDLLEKADKAMYQAKKAGKNQFRLSAEGRN
ncbi:bifunctional diguanylate cyclase/phosphodiesterase [Methylophaga sp. OBS3]|uniref:sensor domain-containing protein n=1 Tax=Methylophaga sp. OBS3 TaxID=2991934 RepID=UPI0022512A80|nr:sensor domain-containing diguanylate cyclase [Methylophaga sp. OBS3]MCX4189614.1 PAS domain S-box protein [Methylophaga sp. OBS3]